MAALIMTALPFVAFLGLLVVLGLALVAFFWPSVEWWLLCTLQNRRRKREARHLGTPKVQRLALRRPR